MTWQAETEEYASILYYMSNYIQIIFLYIILEYRSICICCSIRTSFSVVRTIAKMLREEKGRVEDALLALDMRLPLLQNLTSTSQA